MNQVHVIAYFGDDPSRTYQLVQWLDVLGILNERHPVAIVVREAECATVLAARTSLPIHTAESFADLTRLYDELDAKTVLYCNNSMLNFQSLVDVRSMHVHINHGESDKLSMASNNAKAYDRVFVAGECAVQRHQSSLMEFDTSRLVRVGRPQLDLRPESVLPPSTRRTILYAPTWEGDAEYNDYTSVDTMGPQIVRSILGVPGARLVYKAHPKVTTSLTPAVREAHHEILRLLAEAAERDPEAGHVPILTGDILAVMPDCDAIVTDVSSVGLDWLYLCNDRPIFLTDRHADGERLRQDVPVSRCSDVIDEFSLADLTALLVARLEHDEHHLSRLAMRHHYFDDLQVGDSTKWFLEAVSEVVALRDRLLGAASDRPDEGAAITA